MAGTLHEVASDGQSWPADPIECVDVVRAMPDVGGPSYELRLRILDLAKLADVHIAHNDYERRFLEH